VGSFGERMRREREMRGVSLDEIAESTKIGTRLLRALEEEQFDLLPGGIFNKGFVRAYARYLGMDEDQAVADYLQAAGNQEPDIERVAEQQRIEHNYAQEGGSAPRGFPWLPLFLLFLVVAAGFGGWQVYQQYAAEKEREQAQSSAPTSESSPPTASNASGGPGSSSGSASTPAGGSTPVASPPPASSSAGERAPSTPLSGAPAEPSASPQKTNEAAGNSAQADLGPTFEVVVSTTNRAWVSIKADGNITVRGIISSDQPRKVVHAKKEVVVWTGNAGATEVLFEGKPVPVEGGVNQPKVLVFKPDGLQPEPPPKPVAEPPAQTPEPSPTPQ